MSRLLTKDSPTAADVRRELAAYESACKALEGEVLMLEARIFERPALSPALQLLTYPAGRAPERWNVKGPLNRVGGPLFARGGLQPRFEDSRGPLSWRCTFQSI